MSRLAPYEVLLALTLTLVATCIVVSVHASRASLDVWLAVFEVLSGPMDISWDPSQSQIPRPDKVCCVDATSAGIKGLAAFALAAMLAMCVRPIRRGLRIHWSLVVACAGVWVLGLALSHVPPLTAVRREIMGHTLGWVLAYAQHVTGQWEHISSLATGFSFGIGESAIGGAFVLCCCPVFWALSLARRPRPYRARHPCRGCGYELLGTTGRCPECGRDRS